MAKGKRYDAAARRFDPDQEYPVRDAVDLVKAGAAAKFDEGVDLVARLGVDPRKADQMLRGTIALPSGSGKDVRVAVFATGDQATAAKEAGADVVGADDLVAEVEGGRTDFDEGDTLCYSAAAGDVDGDGKTDIITNEMVGNGTAPDRLDVGNLIVLSGEFVSPPANQGLSASRPPHPPPTPRSWRTREHR